jgi:TP901 family phage tail tape measure protein
VSQVVTLKVSLDKGQAVTGLRELNAQVKAAFSSIQETVAATNRKMQSLTLDPAKVQAASSEVSRALAGITARAEEAVKGMWDLSGVAGDVGKTLKGVGTQAQGAETKIKTLGAASSTTAGLVGDLASGADTAGAALDALDDGAAMASKSVGLLGRAAAGALPRIEALSGTVFDAAGIVGGADEATAALERVKLAAAQARSGLRGAFGGGGFGGGGRLAFVGSPDDPKRPGTFGEGLRSGFGAAGDLAGTGAALTTILAGFSGKLAASFDNTLQGIVGNTTMSPSDSVAMRRQVLALMQTGTPAEDLARGYMHVQNFGYHGQDAAHILGEANRFGVGTHTPVEETADVLAGILNAYKHTPAENVGRVANTVHFAAAGSNMEIGQLEKNSTRTVGLAANYGVGLDDALAAYSALVQHRLSPARADTQIAGIQYQIAAPTPKAQKAAARLGITDFNALGLANPDIGLYGVMQQVREKVGALPKTDQAGALRSLFNNKQGGIGAQFLTGSASEAYTKALFDPQTGTRAALSGKTDAISPLYNAQMQQTQQAFKAMSGTLQSQFIPVGEKLGPVFRAAIPVIKELGTVLVKLLDGFAKLPRPIQEAVLGLGALKIISALMPLFTGFSLVSEKTGGALKALAGLFPKIGGAAAEGEVGVASLGVAMSGPFAAGVAVAIASVVALLAAWKTDFGGIREAFAPLLADVKKTFSGSGGAIRDFINTTLPDMKKFGQEVTPLFRNVFLGLATVVKTVFDTIKGVIELSFAVIGGVFRTVLALLTGDWKGAWEGFKSIFSGAWAAIVQMANDLLPEFMAWISNLGTSIKNGWKSAVSSLKSDFLNSGKDLAENFGAGIRSGIASIAPGIAAAAHSLASLMPEGVRSALDIHSPSRVMRQIGQNATEGFRLGITDNLLGVVQAGLLLSDAAITSAGSGRRKRRPKGPDVGYENELGRDAAAAETNDPYARDLANLNARATRMRHGGTSSSVVNAFLAQGRSQIAGKQSAALAKLRSMLGAAANVGSNLLDIGVESGTGQLPSQVKAEDARQENLFQAGQDGDPAGTSLAQYDAYLAGRQKLFARDTDEYGAFAQKRAALAKIAAKANRDASDSLLQITDPAAAQKKEAQDRGDQMVLGGADPVEVHKLVAAQIAQIDGDAADARAQHDMETNAITLTQYASYLQKRRDAFAKYSSQWLQYDSELYQTDTDLQRKQLDAIEELFDAKKITLPQYQTQLKTMLGSVPQTSPVYKDIVTAQAGAQKQTDKQMIGGTEMWGGLRDSASKASGDILTALLTGGGGKKKNIYKEFWGDLADAGKNALSGVFSGLANNGLKSLFGGGAAGAGSKKGGILGSLLGSFGGPLGGLLGGLFADGGSPPVGVPSIVGERGPELFVPRVPGTVIPNHKMAGALAGGGSSMASKTLSVSQNFHGPVTMNDSNQGLDDLGRFLETLDRNSG